MAGADESYEANDRTDLAVGPATARVLGGLRLVMVVHDQPRASHLADELRARGAEISVIEALPSPNLRRIRDFDPEVVLFDPAALEGTGLALTRSLNADERMRWASVLRTPFTRFWPDDEPQPDLQRLATMLAPLVDAERSLRQRVRAESHVVTELDRIGPNRLLRILEEFDGAFGLTVENPEARSELTLAGGSVVTAIHDISNQAGPPLAGPEAVGAFMMLRSGLVEITRMHGTLSPDDRTRPAVAPPELIDESRDVTRPVPESARRPIPDATEKTASIDLAEAERLLRQSAAPPAAQADHEETRRVHLTSKPPTDFEHTRPLIPASAFAAPPLVGSDLDEPTHVDRWTSPVVKPYRSSGPAPATPEAEAIGRGLGTGAQGPSPARRGGRLPGATKPMPATLPVDRGVEPKLTPAARPSARRLSQPEFGHRPTEPAEPKLARALEVPQGPQPPKGPQASRKAPPTPPRTRSVSTVPRNPPLPPRRPPRAKAPEAQKAAEAQKAQKARAGVVPAAPVFGSARASAKPPAPSATAPVPPAAPQIAPAPARAPAPDSAAAPKAAAPRTDTEDEKRPPSPADAPYVYQGETEVATRPEPASGLSTSTWVAIAILLSGSVVVGGIVAFGPDLLGAPGDGAEPTAAVGPSTPAPSTTPLTPPPALQDAIVAPVVPEQTTPVDDGEHQPAESRTEAPQEAPQETPQETAQETPDAAPAAQIPAAGESPAVDPDLDPREQANMLIDRANDLEMPDEAQAAKALYEQALTLRPRSSRAFAGLARVHLELEEETQAIRFAERAVRAAPRRPSYLMLLGDAYFAARDGRAARQAWLEAWELRPSPRLRRRLDRVGQAPD